MSKPRSSSPFYVEKDKIKDPDATETLITEIPKVHRIRCRQNYNAIITNVVSPGEIWIQIMNHICDSLFIPASDAPMLEEEIVPDKYVMTPIDDEKLVRGRIIKAEDSMIFIRLIDYGTVVLRDENAVFQMPTKLYYYPWQSKPVLLYGVKPKFGDEWTPEEAHILKSILVEFDFVHVKPSLSVYAHLNDDRVTMSVEMLGMNGSIQQKIVDENGIRIEPESYGIDIASLYHLNNATPSFEMIEYDEDQEIYSYPAKFDDLYPKSYQYFDITPNPNNAFSEETAGFNDVSDGKDWDNAPSRESFKRRLKYDTTAAANENISADESDT